MSDPAIPGLRVAAGPDDPALYDVDAGFQAVLDSFKPRPGQGEGDRGRLVHAPAAALGGRIEFVETPGVPVHPFFAPGRRYPVLARYSNAGTPDDIAPGIRGLSLMFLDPLAPDRPDRSPFNLTFNTGVRLFARSFAEFAGYLFGGDERRAAFLEARPELRRILWEQIRAPVSFSDYHYYSQVPRLYLTGGHPLLVRYRIVPAGHTPDPGRVRPGDGSAPPVFPQHLTRDPGDTRLPTMLRDQLLAEAASGVVHALLQLQLYPLGTDPEANRAALDPSEGWPQDRFPYVTAAELTFDEALGEDAAEHLLFDPAAAPAGLGIALARSSAEAASVNHGRALVYRMRHAARTERPATPTHARRVCVIGAGASGLSAAWELQRLGHSVVVLEQADEVGGKSVSVEVDGRAYDLGAHVCTPSYGELSKLADECGADTENATPVLLYDARLRVPRPHSAAFPSPDTARAYRRLRDTTFPDIGQPGMAAHSRALAHPTGQWLKDNGLELMAESFEPGYTASGYGYLDSAVPVAYFLKYAELTGLISAAAQGVRHIGLFTVAGGFGGLWKRVAARLADVRNGCRITGIERRHDGVTVHTDDGPVHADDLIVSVPPDQVLHLLKATSEECRVAARVRRVPYFTVLCRISGLPREGMYLVRSGDRPAPPGHCVAFHNRYAGSDVYTAYAYGADGLDTHDIERLLRDDVARMHGRVDEVLTVREWPFMPHFGSEDLAEGALERLERMQGRNRTYYTGSLLAFELVETNIAYSRALVRRCFSDGSTADPAHCEPEPAVRQPSPDRHGYQAVTEWIKDYVTEQLGHPPEDIDLHAPLEDYGLDSLQSAALQARLSEWLGLRLPPTLLFELPTLDAVAQRVVRLGAEPQERPDPRTVQPRRPARVVALNAARPLFCVGGIVGLAQDLSGFAAALGPGHPCYGLRVPGMEDDDPPPDSVERLAALYIRGIRATQPHGPYALAGYSFGGLVAYEMGRQLRQAGEPVAAVLALDTYIPLPHQAVRRRDKHSMLVEVAAARLRMEGARLQDLTSSDLTVDRCREIVRDVLGGADAPVDDRGQERVLAVYQANLQAYTNYRVPPSDLPVTLFKATEEFAALGARGLPDLPLEALDNGWASVRGGGLHVVPVSGSHFSMISGDHARELADAVRQVLDEVWTR